MMRNLMKKRGSNFYLKATILLIGLFMLMLQAAPDAKAAGELRVGWESDEFASSLQCNDSWQYDSIGCIWWQLIYGQAWHYGPPTDYAPQWRAVVGYETKDNKNFRFFIREGMTFHDGKPVTAEDLGFSYEHLPVSNPVWAFAGTLTVKGSVIAVDDYTLDFELVDTLSPKTPPYDWFPILPKHLWKRHKFDMSKYSNKKAIGSGPFMLESFKAGRYMSFIKNENYWEKNDRVDRIVFKTYGAGDAMSMAIKRDEIDMYGYGGFGPLAAKMLEKEDNIDIITSPGIGVTQMTFNLYPEGPLKDLNVRKALVHAIDKDRIIQMVYHGQAVKIDSLIYPEMADYNPNLPQYDYNLDTANKLLDDGGYKDTDGDGIRNDPNSGKNLSFKFLLPSSYPEQVKMAHILKEEWVKLGIDTDLNNVDLDTYYDLVYYPQNPAWDISFIANEPGPYSNWIWEYLRSHGDDGSLGWNTSYYANPEFDKLFNALNVSVDLEESTAIVKKLQLIMATDLPYYVICRPHTLDAVRTDKLTGYVPYMGGISSWINPFTFFNVHAK